MLTPSKWLEEVRIRGMKVLEKSGDTLQHVTGIHGRLDHRPLAMWAKTDNVYQKRPKMKKWDWQGITKTMKHGSSEEEQYREEVAKRVQEEVSNE